jgi:hypothetical protein
LAKTPVTAVSRAPAPTGWSNTTHLPIGMVTSGNTETQRQITVGVAGTFSKLGGSVNDVGASRAFRFRKNTANGNQLASMTDTTAGFYEDTSNTDAVSVGDAVSIHGLEVGTNPSFWSLRLVFEASSGHASIYRGLGSYSVSGDNTSYYTPMFGTGSASNSVTLAANQYKAKVAGTMSYGQINITGNTRTLACTLKLNINGSAGSGIAVSITGLGTGIFVDTSGTEAVAADDLLTWEMITGGAGGTTINALGCCGWFVPTSGIQSDCGWCGGANHVKNGSASAEEYYGFNSTTNALTATEADVQVALGMGVKFSKFRVNVGGFGLSGGTGTRAEIRIRKNGADGNSVLLITGTGWSEDASNEDTFTASDLFSIGVDENGYTTGTMTIRGGGLIAEDTSAGGTAHAFTWFGCFGDAASASGAASATWCD